MSERSVFGTISMAYLPYDDGGFGAFAPRQHILPSDRLTVGHKLACRLRPHTANDRLHQGHQPLREERVGKLFLDLHTVSAPSGEERTLGAAAQVERARWCCRRFDSDTQTRCGSAGCAKRGLFVTVSTKGSHNRLFQRSKVLQHHTVQP